VPFTNLDSEPNLAEPIARYLFEKGHYSSEKAEVKYRAWMPPKNKLKSVYRIVGLSEAEIWQIGKEQVEPEIGHSILARADVGVRAIVELGLQIVPSEPPPRHANVTGWPDQKEAQMSKAQELAAVSVFRQRPTQVDDIV
jgi:hypothetical protein